METLVVIVLTLQIITVLTVAYYVRSVDEQLKDMRWKISMALRLRKTTHRTLTRTYKEKKKKEKEPEEEKRSGVVFRNSTD